MRPTRFLPIPLILALVALIAACSADPTPTPVPTATPEAMMDDGAMKDDAAMMDDGMMMAHETQVLVNGWYEKRQVKYYEFGTNSPAENGTVSTAPIFVFITGFDANGDPMFVEGQHNIVATIPGVDGYSDLWRVMLVEVPDSYTADTIQSKADIDAAGYNITATDILVNCPIVPEGTVLEGGEELVQGWYDGTAVYYPDFGMNPAETAPIYAFVTGFDDDGNPVFVEGQHNVIGVVPGDVGYSAFWEVNIVVVPADYVAGTIKDVDGVMSSGYEMAQPGLVVNCPVTVVADA